MKPGSFFLLHRRGFLDSILPLHSATRLCCLFFSIHIFGVRLVSWAPFLLGKGGLEFWGVESSENIPGYLAYKTMLAV